MKGSERLKKVLLNCYYIFVYLGICCLYVCTYHTVECTCAYTEDKWCKNACCIIKTLCVLTCVFILVCSHVYVSEQIGPTRTFWWVGHASVTTHQIISDVPPPAARAMMQTLIIHAVWSNLPSHEPRWREQPTAIIMSSSIPMFSRLEMPGAQLSAVQKCPGCTLPEWQDHSGLQAASSYQPQGLGYLLYMGRVPGSSVALCMYVWCDCVCTFLQESAVGPSYSCCEVYS